MGSRLDHSLLTRAGRQTWRRRLDKRLGGLPVDWRLLVPFFAAGFLAGAVAFFALLVFVASYGG